MYFCGANFFNLKFTIMQNEDFAPEWHLYQMEVSEKAKFAGSQVRVSLCGGVYLAVDGIREYMGVGETLRIDGHRTLKRKFTVDPQCASQEQLDAMERALPKAVAAIRKKRADAAADQEAKEKLCSQCDQLAFGRLSHIDIFRAVLVFASIRQFKECATENAEYQRMKDNRDYTDQAWHRCYIEQERAQKLIALSQSGNIFGIYWTCVNFADFADFALAASGAGSVEIHSGSKESPCPLPVYYSEAKKADEENEDEN